MKTLLLLALTMAFGPLQTHGDLLDFLKLIVFATGKNAFLDYAFYGCHCGLGGEGTPKDETDRCCAAHDCCYKHLEEQKCGTKFLKYNVTFQNGQIVCRDQDSCPSQLCECDKTAAICFGSNRHTYKKQYQFYPNILCTGPDPPC
ncbi:unnamed protein product [Pipistrellus nathusii]|uniref:Phospholipase A2 n=1 Tax=Pipistrellus nathusii TaxID=59473 RepID=A0ABN9ZUT3_PIPNA